MLGNLRQRRNWRAARPKIDRIPVGGGGLHGSPTSVDSEVEDLPSRTGLAEAVQGTRTATNHEGALEVTNIASRFVRQASSDEETATRRQARNKAGTWKALHTQEVVDGGAKHRRPWFFDN